MTKTNENIKGTTGTQGNQANVNKNQGAQAGGKSSPAGGPETFESDQVNQGKSGSQQGGQAKSGGQQGNQGKTGTQKGTTPEGSQGSRDPYPPVNPDRPMMAGGQQGGKNVGSQGGNFGAQQSGNVGSTAIGGATGAIGTPGLDEEE